MKSEYVPYEYVADVVDVRAPGARDVTDPVVVGDAIVDYLRSRILGLVGDSRDRVGIMLSGGIDSILLAAVAHELGISLFAVTVAADRSAEDVSRSEQVAAYLGIHHEVVVLGPEELFEEVGRCLELLGVDEVWEVLSAVPIRKSFERLTQADVKGPVLTGTGADAIYAGGKWLSIEDLGSREARTELNEIVSDLVIANFRKQRLVPDFYDRILGGDAGRFVMAFQTVEAWKYSQSIAPEALWGYRDGRLYDKFALRLAAERMGVPSPLLWTTKSPLQRSSGLVAAIGGVARLALAVRPGASTYTDPRFEDAELFLARLALRSFHDLRSDLALAVASGGVDWKSLTW